MSQTLRWNHQEDMLWVDKDGLRLVIHPHSAKGYVRFVVIDNRDPNHCPDRLIGSGTLEDVPAARDAAQRMADRFTAARGLGPDMLQHI
jgi:hypothetical protein